MLLGLLAADGKWLPGSLTTSSQAAEEAGAGTGQRLGDCAMHGNVWEVDEAGLGRGTVSGCSKQGVKP